MIEKGKLNILIVSWSFPPAKNPKAVKTEAIVTELLRLEHQVSLLTRVKPDHKIDSSVKDQFKKFHAIPSKDWFRFSVNLASSINWLSIHKYKRMFNGLMLKLFAYPGVQAFFEIKNALENFKEEYDLCLSVDGPQQMHWGVALQKNRNRLKCKTWIADCGDPLTRLGLGNMVAPYFKFVENWFCHSADYITVPVKQGFNYFLPRFKHKTHLVRHSLLFPDKEIKPVRLSAKYGIPTFAYAGNMMPYQNEAGSFFAFLNSLQEDFKFVTLGGNEQFINELLQKNSRLRPKVIVKGKMGRFDLLREMKGCDFLIYLKFSGKHQVSFKLIDYDYVNLPVFQWANKKEDRLAFKAFLGGDYRSSLKTVSYTNYDSKVTVKEYLKLLN